MLSDRSYMRDDYPREKTSVLTWLLCGIAAAFVLQLAIGASWFRAGPELTNGMMLTIEGLKSGQLWTVVSYSFLHDTRYLFHVAGNLLALYFLGRELLPLLGARRFLGLYAGALLLGALTWTAVHWRTGGKLYGATAGIDALLVVFACFYPHRRMDFLLFFIFPVSFKPKHLVLAMAGIDILGLVSSEIGLWSLPFDFPFAHSAHLGGMMAGWLYFTYLHDVRWQLPTPPPDVELPRRAKVRNETDVSPHAEPVSNIARPDLRAEVDRVLDKINSDGFGALTAEEKRLLDEAKDVLSRR